MEKIIEENRDEWLQEELKEQKHKPSVELLSRKKLSKYEMDELFATD